MLLSLWFLVNLQYLCQKTISTLPDPTLALKEIWFSPDTGSAGFSSDGCFFSHSLQVLLSPEVVLLNAAPRPLSFIFPETLVLKLMTSSTTLHCCCHPFSFLNNIGSWHTVGSFQYYSYLHSCWFGCIPRWSFISLPTSFLNSSPLILSSTRFQALLPMIIPCIL